MQGLWSVVLNTFLSPDHIDVCLKQATTVVLSDFNTIKFHIHNKWRFLASAQSGIRKRHIQSEDKLKVSLFSDVYWTSFEMLSCMWIHWEVCTSLLLYNMVSILFQLHTVHNNQQAYCPDVVCSHQLYLLTSSWLFPWRKHEQILIPPVKM